MKNIDEYKEKTFDNIRHIDELGHEYWEARELMTALGYSKWVNFKKLLINLKYHVILVTVM